MSFVLARRSGLPLGFGSVKLAARPTRQMRPMAMDVEPGDEWGTLRVRVFGFAPPYAGTRIESDVLVTEEDDAGNVLDEVRVVVRLQVSPRRSVR